MFILHLMLHWFVLPGITMCFTTCWQERVKRRGHCSTSKSLKNTITSIRYGLILLHAPYSPSVTLFTTGINIHLRWSDHKWSAETHYHSHLVLTCVSCDHLRANFIEGRVSDFMTTYITYYVSVSLHVDVRLTKDVPWSLVHIFVWAFPNFPIAWMSSLRA